MITMRAKMLVTEVNRIAFQGSDGIQFQDRIKLVAVAAKTYPADGKDEDNTYARFSPAGELSLTIANPDLIGVVQPFDKFYLDFTKAE